MTHFNLLQTKESVLYNAEFGYSVYSNATVYSYTIYQNGTGKIFSSDYGHDRKQIVERAKYEWNRLTSGEHSLLNN